MRKLSFILSFLLLSFLVFANDSNEAIRKAVERQMSAYPKSTLKDLYKNFFQDRFGPGHILSDTTAAGRYLNEELSIIEMAGPLYEPTGYEGNFYRVNLSVIKNGLISRDEFFNIFAKSAVLTKPVSVETWKVEWFKIDSIIYDMNLPLANYEQDRKDIALLLSQNRYVMHHSQVFNDTYSPHYRIISKDLFKNEILPLIEK